MLFGREQIERVRIEHLFRLRWRGRPCRQHVLPFAERIIRFRARTWVLTIFFGMVCRPLFQLGLVH